MNEKISIIVPVYNVEKYIAAGIEAMCAQTYSNIEIILVDDGSTDRSGAICDTYARKDERIKAIHIENSGQSHARNVGLSYASGDFIGFVDGDDAPHPSMYERLIGLMKANNADIAECNFVGRNSPSLDQIEEEKIIILEGKKALHKQLDMKNFARYPSTSVWSKLFKRELIENLRFPDGKIHEEYAYLCKALYRCRTYVYVNEILYNRMIRNDSTTKEEFSVRTLDKLSVHRERNEFLEQMKEKELLKLSKAQEYSLMIHFYNLSCEYGMKNEAAVLYSELRQAKRQIIFSRLPLQRKLSYVLFYLNKKVYKKIRELSN